MRAETHRLNAASMFGHPLWVRAAKLFSGANSPSTFPKASVPAVAAPFSADQVLAPNAALLGRIRAIYGFGGDQFDRHLLAPISALAEWLHTLPGPPDSGFEHHGGAVEQTVTHCLCCLQAADGLTFGSTNVLATVDTAPRWQLACALGGLFASLPQLLSRIEVASTSGHLWPSTALPLQHWLATNLTPQYRHRWKCTADDADASIAYVASRCIAPDVMAYLVAGGDSRIGTALLTAMAGRGSPLRRTSPLSELVDRVTASVAALQHPHEQRSASERHPDGSPPTQSLHTVTSTSSHEVGVGTAAETSDRAALASKGAAEPCHLSLDTSTITNPFVRERVEETVDRLDRSFDKMLAKITPDGIFIALNEFSTQGADNSAIVRALLEGGVLATDPLAPGRRVTHERIEGADVAGVVVASAKLCGLTTWLARWQLATPDDEAQP